MQICCDIFSQAIEFHHPHSSYENITDEEDDKGEPISVEEFFIKSEGSHTSHHLKKQY